MDSAGTPSPPIFASQVDGKALDVSDIQGNVSEEMKRESLYVFRHFVSTQGNSYGAEVGERIKMTSVNIWGDGGEACGETVFEITVEKDMCNIFGTLHGACAAYIVDPCSVSSLVVLGRVKGIDGTGVSQSMNLIWHHPVRLGTKLRIVSTSMSLKGRVRTARCELWDGDTLCVSAVHSTVNPGQKRTKGRL
ncbi:hypothetical protein NLJ89_g4256 [Agrocybe chaxingu]|uniref:Thioesterase domain-containing protein n=1 Tax=Agrocybe chaxingu TaxID=84603 RepID=A0A9W8MUQ6_9AGAR|nr:hypothetical protein NLJ89_g4256 [Agrocybe chaxingu]